MRHYLIYSSSAHILLLAVFFIFARNSFTVKKQSSYTIDFIGPGRVVTMEKAGASPGPETPAAEPRKAAKARAEESESDEALFSKGKGESLPKPSVLGGTAKLFEPQPADKDAGENGSPVLADLSNFPYPWYITQVREALWNSWTEKMPSGGRLKCTVKFDIRRGGAVKDINIERSSGNRLFDYAAETSVENAGPLPPLPDDFYEDTLTVHVEFKTQQD
jgi:protein TonB